MAGVEPVYRDVDWDDAAVVGYVKRDDLIRRNLTESQRAMIIVGLNELLPRGGDRRAEEASVSERTIKSAAKVAKRASPEVAEAVLEGKLPVHTAAKVASLPTEMQKEIAAATFPHRSHQLGVIASPLLLWTNTTHSPGTP